MKKFFRIAALFAFVISVYSGMQWIDSVSLPSQNDPILFYSPQFRQDVRKTFLEAIRQADHSIRLIIFSMRDPAVISALNQKANEGKEVAVVYDSKAAANLDKQLSPKIRKVKRNPKGIVHQKILVVDKKIVFAGSANMTTPSLRYYGNLVVGLWDHRLSEWIADHIDQMQSFNQVSNDHKLFEIGRQNLNFWFLPHQSEASEQIKRLIRSAKEKIRIAQFMWTREDFAGELIDAYHRGVDVEVIIDRQSGLGAGRNVAQMLSGAGVSLYFNRGDDLLHFKMMIIDDEILVNGSANWTKAAFLRNDDCFFVLSRLTKKQKKYLNNLWKAVLSEAYQEVKV